MNAKLTTLAIIAALFSVSSYASDPVTINVTGKVVASPCTLDTANSTLDIDVGTKQTTALAAAGAELGGKAFNIALKDCPAGTTSVMATFTGVDDPSAAPGNGFKNAGTATNVTIQLKNALAGGWNDPNYTIKSGGSWTKAVDTTTNTVVYNLAARAYTPTGSVAPGTVSASIVVDFTYQ
ncbi:fimbrial protein [Franconibacter helveticus]|uniref:fimbrial protein n=1 Tax=Franconibacter helveticus TaxID=357240 RepID=UPI000DA22924|nr:fimbrial protein [Franconibacter helveticus]